LGISTLRDGFRMTTRCARRLCDQRSFSAALKAATAQMGKPHDGDRHEGERVIGTPRQIVALSVSHPSMASAANRKLRAQARRPSGSSIDDAERLWRKLL
jgi:hypothetical protein